MLSRISCHVFSSVWKPKTMWKNPTFLVHTLLIHEPITNDMFRKPKLPKIRGKPDIFCTRTREMVPELELNPTFSTQTHHYAYYYSVKLLTICTQII